MSNDVANIATTKTIVKAMRILHAFSNAEPQLSVGELSKRLGMHKSIVSRLVSALAEWRMLERDPITRRVRLGLGALNLGMQAANQNPVHRLALPLLGALVDKTRHTAHVSTRDHHAMLVLASVQSPDALRVTLQQGDRRPLHSAASGKILLAYLPNEQLEEFISETALPALTGATITNRDTLIDHLAQVRSDKLAWNNGESAVGVGGVAAPVFAVDGSVIAAISSVYPLNLVLGDDRARIGAEVSATARALSAALGWKNKESLSGEDNEDLHRTQPRKNRSRSARAG